MNELNTIFGKDKFHLLIFLWLAIPFRLSAQDIRPENIYVQFNKPFYVVGDTIRFKIYFLNDEIVPSKIVHVDMIDAKRQIVMNKIFRVNNNTAFGSYIIPFQLAEANYMFRCYTRWNLNFKGNNIFSKIIPVYNDFDVNTPEIFNETTVPAISDTISNVHDNKGNINLEILNRSYIKTGESVRLKISIPNGSGSVYSANLSMTVLDHDLIGINNAGEILHYYKDYNKIDFQNIKVQYHAEDSIEINGTAHDPLTGDPINSRVLSIYNVGNSTFRRLRCVNGHFEFKLPVFEGYTYLQIINMNPYQPKIPDIKWIPLRSELPSGYTFGKKVNKTPEIEKYLYYSSLRRKVNEIFYKDIYDSIQTSENFVLPFIPDRSYDMSKYQLIRNVLNFFEEAVVNCAFFHQDEYKKIRLFNTETDLYFMTSPWFFVDGTVIFNDSLVHNIPFDQLKRIDLYNSNHTIFKYFEPIMIQGGVVAVYTKNNYLIDYIRKMPNTLRVDGVPRVEPIGNAGRNTGFTDRHVMPDFDPVIYWNPNIIVDKDQEVTITFPHNDVTGNFTVYVQGMDFYGKPLAGSVSYTVIP